MSGSFVGGWRSGSMVIAVMGRVSGSGPLRSARRWIEDGVRPGGMLRVGASSRGWRWFSAGFVTFLVGFAVVAFTVRDIGWVIRVLAVLLPVGQLPLPVGRFAYTELTDEGLTLDVRVRRRRIPWERVERIELGGPGGRPARVVLTAGSEVKSVALGGFVAGPDADPALLGRLQTAAETHGFAVTVR